jgi:hypothetical protein
MNTDDTIKKIQKEYLTLLESYFVNLRSNFLCSKQEPTDFLLKEKYFESSSTIEFRHLGKRWSSLAYQADRLLNDVFVFWKTNREALQNALQCSEKLSTQVGDLNGNSRYYSNATLRLGLYFDNICLIDPLSIMAQRRETKEKSLTGRNDDSWLAGILVNYLEIIRVKPLLLSQTDLPIAILIPPGGLIWGDNKFNSVFEISKNNTLALFADVLGEQIESTRDLYRLLKKRALNYFEQTLQKHWALNSLFNDPAIKSASELINISKILGADDISDIRAYEKLPADVQSVAHLFSALLTIMLVLEGAELSALEMGIDINIPKSYWSLNKFRQRTIAKNLRNFVPEEVPIQAAIMSESMDWMTAANVDDLTQMREEGIMEEVRKVYRIKRRDLQRATLDNFESATKAVVDQVTAALHEAMNEIKASQKQSVQGWVKQIGKLVSSGALGVASLIFPPLGIPSLVASLAVPGNSLYDLYKHYMSNKEKNLELKNRPIIHMLEIWERHFDTQT